MLGHANHYEPGGASAFPVIREGATVPGKAKAIGAAIPYGSCVTACVDDALIDAGQIDGPESPLQNVQLAATAVVSNAVAGLYGICAEEGGLAQNARGQVATKNVTIEALVAMVVGGFEAHTPLMPDLANPGRLIEATGAAKTVALVAKKVPFAGSAGDVVRVWVHFDGVNGFGNADPTP